MKKLFFIPIVLLFFSCYSDPEWSYTFIDGERYDVHVTDSSFARYSSDGQLIEYYVDHLEEDSVEYVEDFIE